MIEWSDEFCTGQVRVDRQHQRLVQLLGELYRDVAAGTPEAALWRVFGELDRYANHHFAAEEKLMRECGLAGRLADSHLREHAAYRDRIASFKARHAREEKMLAVQVLAFLHRWWVEHILNIDKATMVEVERIRGPN